jgi:hypothetical protein
MKINSRVKLKEGGVLLPYGAITARSANGKSFSKTDEFVLIGQDGKHAILRDSENNLWTVLFELVEIVAEAATLNTNTTVGQGIGFGKKVANWFKKLVGLFKK